MKNGIAVLVACVGLISLSGCNTVAGIGKDVQKGGQVLQDAAKK